MTSPRRREIQWADKTAGHALHLAGADDREPDWQDYSACQDEDPEIFFPAQGGGSIDKARAICGRCFVKADCLAFILLPGSAEISKHGIWSGTTVEERRKLARSARRPTAAEARKAAGVCPAGKHPRTPASIRRRADGRDICRTCEADRARGRYQRERKDVA